MLLNCGVGEDSWEFLDCKEIQPLNSKGNQSWILIGRTDTEAETSILWPPDAKNWLTRKDPNAGKDWRQKEKGMTEDEMVSLTQWTWVWVDSRSWWWTGRPGVLQSMGSLRVGHNWVTSLSLFTFVHWKRKWQPTPVFLPGESLLSMGLHRIGHDWSDLATAAAATAGLVLW